jgi:hypothetical protein
MLTKRFRKISCVCAISVLFLSFYGTATAVPSDIVPEGSTLLDAFAVLAKHNDFVGAKYTPFDFFGPRLWSRGELAKIIEDSVLKDPAVLIKVEQSAADAPALRAIIPQLRHEIIMDGYDADQILRQSSSAGASYDLSGKIEDRENSEADQNKNGQLQSGINGIYRGSLNGNLSSRARYAVSVSDWPEDDKRVFDNDLGPHDFSALQEAYVEIDGRHGLEFDAGRMYDRWGPGYLGAALLGDNAPPFDQLQLKFPFSLGKMFGRDYTFEQMATTYTEFGSRRYQEFRRVTLQFNKQWLAYFADAFKTTDATYLESTTIPFWFTKSLDLKGAPGYTYRLDLGMSYSPAVTSRLYSEFLVDDYQSPININASAFGERQFIPRKIAYLIGGHTQVSQGTSLTLEYDFADPNTYTNRNNNAIWQFGQYDWIGLPTGPNSNEVYARLDQRVDKRVIAAIEYRDLMRDGLSWISPTAKEFTAGGSYQAGNDDSFGIEYIRYTQDPYPYTPGAPGAPPLNNLAPVSQGYVGQYLRASEIDVSYSHTL